MLTFYQSLARSVNLQRYFSEALYTFSFFRLNGFMLYEGIKLKRWLRF